MGEGVRPIIWPEFHALAVVEFCPFLVDGVVAAFFALIFFFEVRVRMNRGQVAGVRAGAIFQQESPCFGVTVTKQRSSSSENVHAVLLIASLSQK